MGLRDQEIDDWAFFIFMGMVLVGVIYSALFW